MFKPSTLLRWYLDKLLDFGMWLGIPCGLDARSPCKDAGAVDDNAWWFPGTGLCLPPFCLLPSFVFCSLCLMY